MCALSFVLPEVALRRQDGGEALASPASQLARLSPGTFIFLGIVSPC